MVFLPIIASEGAKMNNMSTQKVLCPQCGSEMWPDHDAVNKVKVLVCTKPTCLYRIYPDYPRRAGNQEICYICGKLFTVSNDSAGVLCPRCKAEVQKGRNRSQGRPRDASRKVRVIQQRLTA